MPERWCCVLFGALYQEAPGVSLSRSWWWSGFTNADMRFTEVEWFANSWEQDTHPGLSYSEDWTFKQLAKLWAFWYCRMETTQRIRNLTPYCPAATEIGVRLMAVLASGVVSWLGQKLAQELEMYLHMQQRLKPWFVLGLFFWSFTLFSEGRIACLSPVAGYLCSESSLLLLTLGSYYFTKRLFLGVGFGFAVPCSPKTLSILPLIPLCCPCLSP